MINRCDVCRGKKTICGLGGMDKNCPACLGVGFINKLDDKAIIADVQKDGKIDRRKKFFKEIKS